MGFAYPSSLGAKLADPNASVICIVGDGVWEISLHEVSRVVEENIPVVALVFNNGAWCAEKKNQVDFYNIRFVGADIDNPDFSEVARSVGAVGIRVDDLAEIGPSVERVKSNKPTVIDIQVDGTNWRHLKMPTRQLPKYAYLDHRNW
ncbi:thiamine pyrophosphate-dependent enzyme [Peribacillus sp. NPDC060186]